MKYRFRLSYQPTDPNGESAMQMVNPVYGEDLNIAIEKESDEWYYKRKMSGKLTFKGVDYSFIKWCAFDGTFTLTVEKSTDGGQSWQEYFEGSFSRASLEIDEDNREATLDGLEEGVYAALENGKSEEYDLKKLIPDAELKTVEGEVHPALAMVDYRSESITKSDVYCGSAGTMGGYKADKNNWGINKDVRSDSRWLMYGVFAEAKVTMRDGQTHEAEGRYVGKLAYQQNSYSGLSVYSVDGWLINDNNCRMSVSVAPSSANYLYLNIYIYGSDNVGVVGAMSGAIDNPTGYYNPQSIVFEDFGSTPFAKVEIIFHYIRATLLTQSADGVQENVLDTGDYYKGMRAFDNSDGRLEVTITSRTVETPNGHRLVTGTGERGEAPQYFAPPDDSGDWIPLAEDNWNYGSMWYKITPSEQNGLLNRALVGSFQWSGWSVGTCLRYLLEKITQGEVTFEESESGSRFLYGSPNPVDGGEPFEYIVTQKSNVMRPSKGGESASRCPVRLDWFLELLRNAFNCYYWLEKRNDGYVMRVEHVEFFRKGHRYDGDLESAIDITRIKTRKNFFRNNAVVKKLSDQTNRYSYELKDMVEKYTFSWQGDGGSDDFKGNPMFFKAGWVEKASSANKEVDNIFADLDWLMLNAGTDTESSKNYDGLFLFAGYRRGGDTTWVENSHPEAQMQTLAEGLVRLAFDLWLTVPVGQQVRAELVDPRYPDVPMIPASIVGTGEPQCLSVNVMGMSGTLRINFGTDYADVTVHRVHIDAGDLYTVPNVDNLLRQDGSTIQNGALAWPWLQVAFLHYDVPAQRWGYRYDDIKDLDDNNAWETTGTIKLCRKQAIGVLPMPTGDPDTEKGVTTGIGTGIIETATVNLGTRNCELELRHEIQ